LTNYCYPCWDIYKRMFWYLHWQFRSPAKAGCDHCYSPCKWLTRVDLACQNRDTDKLLPPVDIELIVFPWQYCDCKPAVSENTTGDHAKLARRLHVCISIVPKTKPNPNPIITWMCRQPFYTSAETQYRLFGPGLEDQSTYFWRFDPAMFQNGWNGSPTSWELHSFDNVFERRLILMTPTTALNKHVIDAHSWRRSTIG
jgi:hypothetical protein